MATEHDTMTRTVLKVGGLNAWYGESHVLHGMDFDVGEGEVVTLLGRNGAGKTTTLKAIMGLMEKRSGSVEFGGVETISLPANRIGRLGIGYCPEERGIFSSLNVEENLLLPPVVRKDGLTTEEIFDLFPNLLERLHSQGTKLSGGEQQRVALARALAPGPRIMLMDEPFSGLDNRLRDEIRDTTLAVLKDSGTAVLLVTHEPDEAMRMADDIALMRDGKIVQQGAPYNIYNAPVDREAVAFFSDVNVIRGTVQGALTETPFGQFLAPAVPEGQEVEIVIRPQHLKIDFDRNGSGPLATVQDGTPARGVVVRARFMGNESLVEFRMDHDGSIIKATVPNVFLPKPGKPLWLTIRRDRCFVFPASG